MFGGHTPQDVQSEDIQRVARFAVNQLNAKSNSMNPLQLVRVLSATTQVVNGIKYNLELEISQGSQNTHRQRVTVLEHPSSGSLQLLDHAAMD
jgi:hypothetical protein